MCWCLFHWFSLGFLCINAFFHWLSLGFWCINAFSTDFYEVFVFYWIWCFLFLFLLFIQEAQLYWFSQGFCVFVCMIYVFPTVFDTFLYLFVDSASAILYGFMASSMLLLLFVCFWDLFRIIHWYSQMYPTLSEFFMCEGLFLNCAFRVFLRSLLSESSFDFLLSMLRGLYLGPSLSASD